jgi:hypothetical protein
MKGARTVIVVLAAAAALATGAALAADTPVDCTTGPGLRDYEPAYKNRSRFLDHLFHTQYGCRALEKFSDKVADLATSWATTNECRAEGNRAAVADTISKVTSECIGGGGEGSTTGGEVTGVAPMPLSSEGQCAKDGKEAGKEAAELYCLPEGLAAAAEEVPLCDSLAALYCKQAFKAYVNAHADCRQRALSDAHYKEAVDAACAPPS